MTRGSGSSDWQRSIVLLSGTVIAVVAVTMLYWAQSIFIPVALAIFLTFLLNPVVSRLRLWGLGRTPAVMLTVLTAALLLGSAGWVVTAQISSVLHELPEHTATVKAKVKSLKKLLGGSSRVTRMIEEINREIQGPPPAPEAAGTMPASDELAGPDRPTAVVVSPETPAWVDRISAFLTPMMEYLGEFALAIILVIFMLQQREEFRNRLIRLVGYGRVAPATRFVDEAGQRISRFLLMQALVNGSFGLVLGAGLLALGVKFAILWGFLGAMLRYLPYVGPYLAAVLPVSAALALTDGWTTTLLVIGLFATLELAVANLIEPRIYGQSMGISEIALLVSAAFWAFLWGPIGLVLSSPLTVCLVMLGRYVPQLEFLAVLLGDEPALDLKDSFYQRLLARDQDEAEALILVRQKTQPADAIFDSMIIPALCATRGSRNRGEITEADERSILSSLAEIVEELGERLAGSAEPDREAEPSQPAAGPKHNEPRPIVIFGCPAHDAADSVALQSLEKLLDPRRWRMKTIAPETLTAERLERIAREAPALVCIASLPPGGVAHTRYLCKRLSNRFPQLRILIGRWGEPTGEGARRTDFEDAGAESTAFSLLETRRRLEALLPLLDSSRADELPAEPPVPALAAARLNSRTSPHRTAAKDLTSRSPGQ
jgi:predicted PurR-regulated permease PerM